MNSKLIIPPTDINDLENKMHPGVLSVGGFLGINERLVDVIKEDNDTLKHINVTHEQLSMKLKELITQALNSSRDSYCTNIFKVKIIRYTGFQICPWSQNIHQEQCSFGNGVDFGSINWTIYNKKKKLKMNGSGLAVHLIGDHHFFEGHSSPYRINPKELCSLFNFCD